MSDRGYFSIGIYGVKYSVNIGTLIRSARSMGANSVYTIGKRYEGQASAVGHDKHIEMMHFEDYDDFRSSMAPFRGANIGEGANIIAVETDSATTLPQLSHPEKAVYLLGAEDKGLPEHILEDVDRVVSIPSEWCLNVSVAGSIAMYDRILKERLGGEPMHKTVSEVLEERYD